jgi:Xaa-Pro dipeptidase
MRTDQSASILAGMRSLAVRQNKPCGLLQDTLQQLQGGDRSMKELAKKHASALQERLKEQQIDVAVISDPSSIYYYTGAHSFLGMEFGRPTVLIIPQSGACSLITPLCEGAMLREMVWLDNLMLWLDGENGEWRLPLEKILKDYRQSNVGVDYLEMPRIVFDFIAKDRQSDTLKDITPTINKMRMVKSPEEIQVARHAGQVAAAMLKGAHDTAGVGVSEYEIALAVYDAGTRKAAELLEAHYEDGLTSPVLHFQQIVTSGARTSLPHQRASLRKLEKGDPLFLCFCGITNFREFKLGFDRVLYISQPKAPDVRLWDIALRAQSGALSEIRPGAIAENVFKAYAEVIRSSGLECSFRAGRSVGYSFNEAPQLALGDKTELLPGMVFAVDGAVNDPGVSRAQTGDSIVVTDTGYEKLTNYSNKIEDLIVPVA